MRKVLARVPKGNAEMVAAAIRTIFAQPDAEHVHSQLDVIAGMLGRQFPQGEAMLRDAADDLLAFTGSPSRTGKRRHLDWPSRSAGEPSSATHRESRRGHPRPPSKTRAKCPSPTGWATSWMNSDRANARLDPRRQTAAGPTDERPVERRRPVTMSARAEVGGLPIPSERAAERYPKE
jgi:hypothetical protein